MAEKQIRSTPQQSRSQQRVDLILQTASNLFMEVGYESATTNAIAERAGISIGSLYRYFPDKESILRELSDRYHNRLRDVYDRIPLDDAVYWPLPVLLDRMVDPIIDAFPECPLLMQLLVGSELSAEIAAVSCAMGEEITRRITSIFQHVAPHLSEDRVRMITMICIAQVKTLLTLARNTPDEAARTAIVREVKQMLLAYLEPIIKSPSSN